MRYGILALICVMYFITYIDRTNISVAGATIAKDLHLSKTELGFIFSAFSVPYALLQMPGGFIGDTLGPRLGLAVIGVVWAGATIATGACRNLATFLVARFALGFGEGGAFPTATRAMTNWMPATERGLAQGVVHSAARLGGAVTPPIVVAIILFWGWRTSFFLLGAVSLVWVVAFALLFRNDPGRDRRVSGAEREEIGTRARTAREPVPWMSLIARMWPVTLCDFCYGWALWVFLTWLPSYLEDVRGFPLASLALFAALPLAAGVVGDTVGGVVSDRVLARTGDIRRARGTQLAVGLVLSTACIVPAAMVASPILSVVLLSLSFFFLELNNAVLWSLPMDIAPAHAGTASGMMNTGFGIAGIISPAIFGWLIDTTAGAWQVPFLLTAALMIVGALVALVLVRPDRRVVAARSAAENPT
jgi:ACS family D-galactonate transporter-like MFS transporter